ITVEIPSEWVDVDGSPWVSDGQVIGAQIKAAVSLDDFLSFWDEPGMFFGASDDLAELGGFIEILDIRRQEFLGPCELDGRYDYEDVLYRGKYDLFFNCGGEGGSWFLILIAIPMDDSTQFIIDLEVQIANDADLEAVDRILDSFEVVATLP
ncbi:MAG: peptidase S1, partial [Anaerolineales bacterium]